MQTSAFLGPPSERGPNAGDTSATESASTLTANVAAGTVVFPPWAFFIDEVKGTPFRDDDWQVGDELTMTLEVPFRCSYGAVERDVVSSTTKTYRVTAIELDPTDFEPIDVTWTEV